jgi:hypothetical protein
VSLVDSADKPESGLAEPRPMLSADLIRQRRGRNLALLAALVGFVVLIYLLSLVKLGGG